MRTALDAKAMAKSIRQSLADRNVEISHGEALEIVARQFGFENWNIFAAKLELLGAAASATAFEQAIPILRIFDVAKAHEFYLEFLGFGIDWEHRFGEDMPLYIQVSRRGLKLHLSEHAGDASPGSNMVVRTKGLAAFHRELNDKNYRYMKPGLERQEWGTEMVVYDPFGNRIRFIEN
jgi:hypothetical protein